jgi:quercetin dioxygenase-like cupin family protein
MSKVMAKPELLDACAGKPQEFNKLIDYSTDAIVSKTVLDKPSGTITLFAFDKGQGLSEHTAPYDAVVVVLDGSAKLTIGGESQSVCAGQIIVMPADVPHSVYAHERFKMLLIMIRSRD